MPSPPTISLEELLAPVPGDDVCGAELRWEPIYDQIKSARAEQSRDPLGDHQQPVVADWPLVTTLATEALRTRTKDLMLAAWLTEALTARFGIAGARDGLRLIHGLLQRYWHGVYPRPDEDDLEPRVAPLAWLMDADRGAKLPNRLRNVPLVPHAEEELSWSYWKSRYAPPKSESEDENTYQRRKAQSQERERKFEEAAAAADVAQLMPIHADVQATMAVLADLNKLATEKFKNLAPGTTAFRQTLEEIEVLLRRIIRGKGGFAAEEAVAADGAATTNNNVQADSSGPIKTRDDAFRRLAEVSAYLRKTEPQSPVPFLIDRAITWGKLPFTQLMEEIIKDANVRGQVGELLGIKAGSGDGKK